MKIFHDYLIFHISMLWTKCFYQLGKYFVIKINLVPLTSFSFKLKLMSHSDFKMKWINERNIESHFSLKASFRPYLCYLEQFVKECPPFLLLSNLLMIHNEWLFKYKRILILLTNKRNQNLPPFCVVFALPFGLRIFVFIQ